jgi:Flp pilus assembly protein TadD
VLLLRRRRYLVTGWFWFLIMLGPVIGIIQVGNQARADRYTYLPQIGFVLLLTWAARDLLGAWQAGRYLLAVAAIAIVVSLAWVARAQTAFWTNSEMLWSHALSATTDNTVAEENLGQALYERGKIEQAVSHLERALVIEPNDAIAHGALGAILLKVSQREQALVHLQRSLEIYPNQAGVQSTLGVALLEAGDVEGSLKHLETATRLDPGDNDAHYNLANTLLQLRRPRDAVAEYQRAVEINPNDTEALNNMAWVLATWPEDDGRDGARAVQWAEKADALAQQRNPVITATLAAAYAEAGRFDDARSTADRALKVAVDQRDNAHAEFIRVQIEVYRDNRPLRDQRYARPAP